MANIIKRGSTFRIRVSCGYDVNGKQVVKSKTYKPDTTKSEKWNEKELQRQAILFEESCKQGQSVTAAKFQVFAENWFCDYAELKLKRLTLCNYHRMKKRAYAALGHIRIDRITPLDIQRYVRSLHDEGLSADNVKNHVRFVSTIMNYAVKKQILLFNPCGTVDYPTGEKGERNLYTLEEVETLLRLLREEKEEKKPFLMFFTLAVFTGCRKGELLGAQWSDFDFNNNTFSIRRGYYYDCYNHTYYTDTPKTKASRRTLKLPPHVMETLKEYRAWQDMQREMCGGSWVENDRLFTTLRGEPMPTTAPKDFLQSFCKRTGMRKVNIHSFRHFNASALINSGVDVVAVQQALGHSTPATTLAIYAHDFGNAKTRAGEAIADVIKLR